MQNFIVAEGMILSEIVRFTLLENILVEYIDVMVIFNVLYNFSTFLLVPIKMKNLRTKKTKTFFLVLLSPFARKLINLLKGL